ncbi:MAG TPA: ABC transporter permease [Candidatus Manganitrophaceae bacterium]|nr:ABC transporter permease [Candidatus Manganitrophaceae bacterium]
MRAWAFVERDLRKFTRNPLAILSSVFLPLVYLLILGNSFQGNLKHLPLGVVDQDQGPYAERMMNRLRALEAGPEVVRLVPFSDPDQAEREVRAGKLKGMLVIPPRFSKDVLRGTAPQVGLALDNTDSVSAATLQRVVSEAFAQLAIDAVPIRPDLKAPRLAPVELYRKVDYDASLVPGAVIMAIFMGTMITGAFNLVMDRFLGVHEAYLSTPLTKRDIILGILISGVFVTTLVSLFVLGAGVWITQVPVAGGLSSFAAVVFVVALTSLGLLGMMCVLLSRVDHPRIVGLFGGFLNVIFFFPSGAIYPVESFPDWLRAFSKVNPETYAVHALKSILFKGAEWKAIQGDLLFLTVFTIVMVVLSTWTFKRNL